MRELINKNSKEEVQKHLQKLTYLKRKRKIRRTAVKVVSFMVDPIIQALDAFILLKEKTKNNLEFRKYKTRLLGLLIKGNYYTVVARVHEGTPVRIIKDSKLYGFLGQSADGWSTSDVRDSCPLRPLKDYKAEEVFVREYLFTISDKNNTKNSDWNFTKYNFRFSARDYGKTWFCIPCQKQEDIDAVKASQQERQDSVEVTMGFEEIANPDLPESRKD